MAPGPLYTQHPLTLPLLGRGSHLITDHITNSLSTELKNVKCGLLHLFLQHTSCALSLNENWDSDVRRDMSDALDRVVVEDKGKVFNSDKSVFRFVDEFGVASRLRSREIVFLSLKKRMGRGAASPNCVNWRRRLGSVRHPWDASIGTELHLLA